MSPDTISTRALRMPTPLRVADTVEQAVRQLLDSDLPALPVLDEHDRYAGIFGEREFMTALFPGYLDQLHGAGYLRRALDDTLQTRDACRAETVQRHMNTEHIDVGPDHADIQVAEIFLHHRVLIIPVVDDLRLVGIITRREFFRSIASRFLR
jgi:CBS domain-containing protein